MTPYIYKIEIEFFVPEIEIEFFIPEMTPYIYKMTPCI